MYALWLIVLLKLVVPFGLPILPTQNQFDLVKAETHKVSNLENVEYKSLNENKLISY